MKLMKLILFSSLVSVQHAQKPPAGPPLSDIGSSKCFLSHLVTSHSLLTLSFLKFICAWASPSFIPSIHHYYYSVVHYYSSIHSFIHSFIRSFIYSFLHPWLSLSGLRSAIWFFLILLDLLGASRFFPFLHHSWPPVNWRTGDNLHSSDTYRSQYWTTRTSIHPL